MIAVCIGPATWRDLQHALLLRQHLPEFGGMRERGWRWEWMPLSAVLTSIGMAR